MEPTDEWQAHPRDFFEASASYAALEAELRMTEKQWDRFLNVFWQRVRTGKGKTPGVPLW